MSPTSPRTPAAFHYQEAERTLDTIGALGADEAERIVEVLTALVHGVLSIAATLALPVRDPRSDAERFAQDHG